VKDDQKQIVGEVAELSKECWDTLEIVKVDWLREGITLTMKGVIFEGG
jgi:hypothetical protein